MSNYIPGLDVSVIQGQVDWAQVATAGYRFVILRCGVGNDGIDSNYQKNITGAISAGLQVMAYHFVFPLPTTAAQPLRDPVKQAQYHFAAAGSNVLAACDFEWPTPDQWAKWGCTASQMSQWCLAYLQEYERLSGQKMVIYTYPYFAQALNLPADFAQYPLWIASYEPTPAVPAPWTDWVLWQNTGGGGKLPGSGAAVDTDLAKDLSLWNVAPVAPNVPVPVQQPDPPAPPPPTTAPAPVPAPAPVVPAAPATDAIQQDFSIILGLLRAFMNLFKVNI